MEIDRALGGKSVWAVYGHCALGTLIVANGVRSISGDQPIPQLALWGRLDPEGRLRAKYNRYANVHMEWPPPPGQPVGVGLVGDGNVTFYLEPDGIHVRALGVTHLLVTAAEGSRHADYFSSYEPLARVGHHAIFSLPLQRKPER